MTARKRARVRALRSDWKGERVSRSFRLPVDLDVWLRETAAETAWTEADLVVRALFCLREYMGGPISPVAEEVLRDAIARSDALT